MNIDKINFNIFLNHFKQNIFTKFKINYTIKIINDEFLFELFGKYNSECFSIFGIYDKCFKQINSNKLEILNTQINFIKKNIFYKNNQYRIFIYSYSFVNRYEENNIFICSHLNFIRSFMEKLNYKENFKQNIKEINSKETNLSKIKKKVKFASINKTNKNKRLRTKYKVDYKESSEDDDEIYQDIKNKYKGNDYKSNNKFVDLNKESQQLYEDTLDFFSKEKWTKLNVNTNIEYIKPSLKNIKSDNNIFLLSDNDNFDELLSDKDNNFNDLINSSNKTTFILNNIDEIEIDGISYKNITNLKLKVDRDIYDILKKE
jgi:hypothetical protein